MNIPEISPQALYNLKLSGEDFFLLDVRNPEEYKECNLGGYLIPIQELPTRIGELQPKQKIIVHCLAGGRSKRAAQFLLEQGFKNVQSLQGGLSEWRMQIDPELKVK